MTLNTISQYIAYLRYPPGYGALPDVRPKKDVLVGHPKKAMKKILRKRNGKLVEVYEFAVRYKCPKKTTKKSK